MSVAASPTLRPSPPPDAATVAPPEVAPVAPVAPAPRFEGGHIAHYLAHHTFGDSLLAAMLESTRQGLP